MIREIAAWVSLAGIALLLFVFVIPMSTTLRHRIDAVQAERIMFVGTGLFVVPLMVVGLQCIWWE